MIGRTITKRPGRLEYWRARANKQRRKFFAMKTKGAPNTHMCGVYRSWRHAERMTALWETKANTRYQRWLERVNRINLARTRRSIHEQAPSA